jgi:hypothetical protein
LSAVELQGINGVWQTELLTTELLVLEPGAFQTENVTERWKRYMLPSAQIPAEVIQSGGKAMRSKPHKNLTVLGIKAISPVQRVYLFTVYMLSDKIYCGIYSSILLF